MPPAPAAAVAVPPLTFGMVLRRGLAAGALAGVAAALVSWLVVERPIRAAIALEEARTAADDHHEEMFSRPTQVVGGMVAAVVIAVAIALVFAIVFARVRHRLPAATDFGRSVLLAAVGFATVALLPALKYPANPPGVGDPATITSRTEAYLSFLIAGVLVAYLAFSGRDWLERRGWPPARRSAAVAVATMAAVAVLFLAWPDNPDPIPADVAAGLLWRFRLASLLELATLWAVLGLGMGLLLSREPAARAAAPAGV